VFVSLNVLTYRWGKVDPAWQIRRVGLNHIFIGIYGEHTVLLAGKSTYVRACTVQIYSSGQPYKCVALS
jgi:hypothetical protein